MKDEKLSKLVRRLEKEVTIGKEQLSTTQKEIQVLQADYKALEEELETRVKDLKQRALGIQTELQAKVKAVQEAQTKTYTAEKQLEILKEFYEQVKDGDQEDS